jgi:hypothetical protein
LLIRVVEAVSLNPAVSCQTAKVSEAYLVVPHAQALKPAAEKWSSEQAYCGHTNWSAGDDVPG